MAHHSCGQSQGGPWLPYWGHEGLKLQCAWACHGLIYGPNQAPSRCADGTFEGPCRPLGPGGGAPPPGEPFFSKGHPLWHAFLLSGLGLEAGRPGLLRLAPCAPSFARVCRGISVMGRVAERNLRFR